MTFVEQARDFLSRHGLHPAEMDAKAIQASFLEEMERGLRGAPSSLAMIPTYVTIDRPVPAGVPVTVMDAGGSNLRVATVVFDENGSPTMTDYHKQEMPGIDHHVSKDDFFTCLAEAVAPLARKSERIGFCFSYATEISPDCDGKLLYWTKEIQAPEVVGASIGAELDKKLAGMGYGGRRIVILNDTIATLLAGKSVGEARRYENYTGVILGTGSNTAYVEKNANIAKLASLNDGAMAINLESGGFAKAPRTDIDEAFDATTANPGKQMFEKMISGGYLGGLGLQVLKTAAREGLFSESARKEILGWEALTTKEMDDFTWNPFAEGVFRHPAFAAGDLEAMMILCEAVVERAALFVAINISTPIIKTGSGKSPLHPVCVTMDGSTFYKTKNLKSMVEANLRRILGEAGMYHEMIKVEEAPIIGAAVAGLTV